MDKENDSDKGKGNQGNEKQDCPGPPGGLPGAGFVGFDEKPKKKNPPRKDMCFYPSAAENRLNFSSLRSPKWAISCRK
jgi:hypothetical protein